MSLDQLSEYIKEWNGENSKKPEQLDNPSIDELRLFNLANGIPRVRKK